MIIKCRRSPQSLVRNHRSPRILHSLHILVRSRPLQRIRARPGWRWVRQELCRRSEGSPAPRRRRSRRDRSPRSRRRRRGLGRAVAPQGVRGAAGAGAAREAGGRACQALLSRLPLDLWK